MLHQLFIVKTLGLLCLWFAMLSSSVSVVDVTVLQKDLVLTKAGIRGLYVFLRIALLFFKQHTALLQSLFL